MGFGWSDAWESLQIAELIQDAEDAARDAAATAWSAARAPLAVSAGPAHWNLTEEEVRERAAAREAASASASASSASNRLRTPSPRRAPRAPTSSKITASASASSAVPAAVMASQPKSSSEASASASSPAPAAGMASRPKLSAESWINQVSRPDPNEPMFDKSDLPAKQLDRCDPKSHGLVACLAPCSSGLHSIGFGCLVIGPLSRPNSFPTMHQNVVFWVARILFLGCIWPLQFRFPPFLMPLVWRFGRSVFGFGVRLSCVRWFVWWELQYGRWFLPRFPALCFACSSLQQELIDSVRELNVDQIMDLLELHGVSQVQLYSECPDCHFPYGIDDFWPLPASMLGRFLFNFGFDSKNSWVEFAPRSRARRPSSSPGEPPGTGQPWLVVGDADDFATGPGVRGVGPRRRPGRFPCDSSDATGYLKSVWPARFVLVFVRFSVKLGPITL